MTPTTANLTLSLARSGGVALGLSLSTGPSMVPGVASSAGTSTAAGVGASRWAAAGLAGGTSTAAGAGRATGPAALAAAILARSPIQYLKLDETSGTTAADSSGNGRNGAYSASGITLGGSFAPFVAPTFNGTNGHVNIHSASLAAALTPSAYTLVACVRPATLAATRRAINIATTDSASEFTNLGHAGTPIAQRFDTNAGALIAAGGALSLSAWGMLTLTASVAGGFVRLFVNGVQAAEASDPAIAAWAAPLSSTRCVIAGVATTGTSARWSGEIAHVALFSSVLSAADIAAIYAASGL